MPSLTTVTLNEEYVFRCKRIVLAKSSISSSPSFLDITPALSYYLSFPLSFTHFSSIPSTLRIAAFFHYAHHIPFLFSLHRLHTANTTSFPLITISTPILQFFILQHSFLSYSFQIHLPTLKTTPLQSNRCHFPHILPRIPCQINQLHQRRRIRTTPQSNPMYFFISS